MSRSENSPTVEGSDTSSARTGFRWSPRTWSVVIIIGYTIGAFFIGWALKIEVTKLLRKPQPPQPFFILSAEEIQAYHKTSALLKEAHFRKEWDKVSPLADKLLPLSKRLYEGQVESSKKNECRKLYRDLLYLKAVALTNLQLDAQDYFRLIATLGIEDLTALDRLELQVVQGSNFIRAAISKPEAERKELLRQGLTLLEATEKESATVPLSAAMKLNMLNGLASGNASFIVASPEVNYLANAQREMAELRAATPIALDDLQYKRRVDLARSKLDEIVAHVKPAEDCCKMQLEYIRSNPTNANGDKLDPDNLELVKALELYATTLEALGARTAEVIKLRAESIKLQEQAQMKKDASQRPHDIL